MLLSKLKAKIFLLKRLVSEKFNVVKVFTNLSKPFGRKQIVTSCAVKKAAEFLNIKVFQPEKFSS